MGKIQAVICPQCGSSNAANLADDKFRCGNCQTVFFIDKEKVEVHVKHSFEPPKPAGAAFGNQSAAKIFGGIFIVTAALIAAVIGLNYFFPKKPPQNQSAGVFAGGNDDSASDLVVTLSKGEPRLFVLVESISRGANYEANAKKIALKMYEPAERKFLREVELIPPSSRDNNGGLPEHDLAVIGDTIWYVNQKSRIFGIDPNSLGIEQTNETVAARFGELASGIGNVERLHYEKGFKIQNNNGAVYFYFPLENKLYREADYNKAKDGIEGKNLVKRFTFEEIEGRSSAVEKMKKLYEIKRFESERGPGRQCVECIYSSFEDLKAGKSAAAKSEIQEIKEFTAERSFFDGQFLYNNDKELLIAFKRTANEKDAPVIQCLDAENGNTKWTVETKNLSSSNRSPVSFGQYNSAVFKADGVFYLTENYYATAIDENGRVLWSFNILNRDDWK